MLIIRIIKKFSKLLSDHQKLRIFELVILMIIGGLLEMCSVSLVIPFMNAVMDPDEIMTKWYLTAVCEALNIESAQVFLVVASVALAMLYILKNIYLMFEYNMQYRFVYNNMFSMQHRLLDTIIHRPYEYFLKADSGELIRVVNIDTPQTFLLLSSLLSLITEIVVSVVIIVTIFFITPLVTVCIAVVMLLLLFIISCAIKPKLSEAGRETQVGAAGMNKWMLQSVHGIKELKVTGSESYFQTKYDEFGYQYVNAKRRGYILGIMPRFLIEAVSMGTVFIIVSVMICRGGNLEEIIPVLTAVAMAAIRLLPAVNRISSGIANVSYNEPMLDKLSEGLQSFLYSDEVPDTHGSTESQNEEIITEVEEKIDFQNITFCYPEGDSPVLFGASMEIKRGESVGIVGNSGAGKTTAVDIIMGLLHPQSGQVCIDGTDISADIEGWHRQIGYIPQFMFLLDDSIKNNVCFGMGEDEISDESLWTALEEASIADFVNALPEGLETRVGEQGMRLSGGQRQRICIARALYKNPAILVFDEATSALDSETEAAIMESINQLHGKKTMIIIAHRLTTIENCDHVFRVEDGKIYMER